MKSKSIKKKIFLDYASITPVSSDVSREMLKVQNNFWGNPSSIHSFGEEAKLKLEEARIRISKIMQARKEGVIFLSSGTEALNLAIIGSIKSSSQKLPHVIVSTIEHSAVLETVKYLIKEGSVEVSFINPDKEGVVRPESIKKELKENTVLVIVQHANNETGVIHPISKIASMLREYKTKKGEILGKAVYPYLLVDASQSIQYQEVSLEKLGADIIVFDGIKIYGPRGSAVLIVKYGVNLSPVIYGGGQEFGLRAGTENIEGALGIAKALEMVVSLREKESKRLLKLRDYLVEKVLRMSPNFSLNGSQKERLPNNVNICFSGFDSEFLVIKLDNLGFAVSSASACNNLSSDSSSYVIESMSKHDCANSSIRFSFGRETKKSDIDSLVLALKKVLV